MIFWIFAGLAALSAALLLWSHLKSRTFERIFPPRGAFADTAFGRLHLTRRDPSGAPIAFVPGQFVTSCLPSLVVKYSGRWRLWPFAIIDWRSLLPQQSKQTLRC